MLFEGTEAFTPFARYKADPFTQVVVWRGCVVGKEQIVGFEEFFKTAGIRIKYLEEITTAPDMDENGYPVKDTGGRVDVFFYVHALDIPKFAIWEGRFLHKMSWLEDVLAPCNYPNKIYPKRVEEYITWNADSKEGETNG